MSNLSWLESVVIGVVEGLTEFLPVSSTGHMILVSSLFGLEDDKTKTFEIVIQLGAILAVVWLYRDRFLGLLRYDPYKPFSGFRGWWMLFLTSAPAAAVGFFARKTIKAELFHPRPVALALLVGGVLMIVVERLRKRNTIMSLDEIKPKTALCIGLFQCLSLWPGFSRAGATIMGGMLLGVGRKTAAEYSFLAAVPIMVAATAYELYKSAGLLSASDVGVFGLGFVVSFFSAWAAVAVFIGLLKRWTLTPFAIYRIILAPMVLWWWV